MKKDYPGIWVRWLGFLQSDIKGRKEVLDALHLEVKQGFSVIAKASAEELEYLFKAKPFFGSLKPELDATLERTVWYGYLLFLISEGIDPVEQNLIVRNQTNELGNEWMEAFEKDKCEVLLLEIDALLALFLQNIAQSECNQLLTDSSSTMDISYKDAGQIISFLQWSLCQGFILGILEKKLFAGKEEVNSS